MSPAPLTNSRDTTPSRKRVKILLVDDTPENLLSLEAALYPLGEELVLAHSGKEALRRLLQDEFAAILLDVRMPEMDGFETAQLIRARARSRSTPILFLTAYSDEHLFRGYGLGAVDFLYKPIIPEILRSKVAVFVELARKADELRQHAILLRQQAKVLRKAEQRFRSLLEVAPDSMVICRADGAITMVNSKTETLFRYSRQELLARDIRVLIRDWRYEVAPSRDQDLDEVAVCRAAANRELAAERRDGTIFPVEINLSPLQTEEGLLIINAIRDITERVRIEEQRRRAEDQLKTLNLRLRALSANVQFAREEEGTRIAREIHDELGSSLTSLKWDLEVLDKILSEADAQVQLPALRDKIRGMMNVTDATVNTVRRIASELRPTILDDLGLLEAVEWQAQQFQTRTGILCQCHCPLERASLNRQQSTAVFRILQEALTNILRHAQATAVEIVMEEVPGEFVLVIHDNGRGIRADEKSGPSSLGILGMQERAHLVGGQVEIAAAQGKGTLVTVRVPLSDHV
jgi:PAS domain S-box-containing protein